LTNKKNQKAVLTQVSTKQDKQRQQLQEKMEQEKAAKLAEMEYERKIQAQKEQGRKMLDELRKQRPF